MPAQTITNCIRAISSGGAAELRPGPEPETALCCCLFASVVSKPPAYRVKCPHKQSQTVSAQFLMVGPPSCARAQSLSARRQARARESPERKTGERERERFNFCFIFSSLCYLHLRRGATCKRRTIRHRCEYFQGRRCDIGVCEKAEGKREIVHANMLDMYKSEFGVCGVVDPSRTLDYGHLPGGR
jgi:hypothetical protein